jgi:lipopolysaccharide export system ATP-binding protein
MTGLRAEKITKSHGARQILKGCSIALKAGEVVGLLGPNGAGKTTLFSIITGLTKADSGKIFLDEDDVTIYPAYRRARMGVGYLPQEPSVFRGMSVQSNILAVLEVFVADLDQRQHQLEVLLVEFGLEHIRHNSVLSLSGGERRRVEIARSLAASPQYILLDEPLAGIDPIAVDDVRKLITQLVKRGIGVLITDHNVRDTLAIVSRAYIIYDGVVLMEGTPKEIIANKKVREIYLGETFVR